MDDLEFRRRIYANPKTSDDDMLHAIASDPKKAQLRASLIKLDDQLYRAVNIPVPEDLPHKLIWQQTTEEFTRHKRRSRWYMGLAASVALTVGVLGTLIYQQQNLNIGNQALAHVHGAANEQPHSAVPVDLQQVNAKLAGFGGRLTGDIGNVTMANFCHLATLRSLHLILDTEQGQMSVFIVPHNGKDLSPHQFYDEQFKGQGWDLSAASVMVVGDRQADLSAVIKKVKSHLVFSV